ncbi:hypothetical protein MNBD_GAMMA24-2462 [hydrothermal vent metagenome]|uniref:Uncharacterized protein n=1 Tax=hydrothermal vent metagenome TaxID=652676 RepID=A0A3B1C4U1_9ZZZZ
MSNVLQFKTIRPKDKHRGKTLCKSGFHQWDVVKENPFDVKSGKMISRYRCQRCGKIKAEAR